MSSRAGFTLIVSILLPVFSANAGGRDELKTYFNDAARKVKAAADPSEKREILNKSFKDLSNALEMVEESPLMAREDIANLDRFRTTLLEKRDELNGLNGYERVSDAQLNVFADYVVQDMEQALETIHISLVALLLIIIIVILIV